MNLAFTFPGQGSQSLGMLSALAAEHPQVREVFTVASDALSYDLWKLTQAGPEARLNATEQTQPAMLAAGVAVYEVWCAQGGVEPQIAAGHSLGEYSALVCAGSLNFSTAVKLVAARGRFMQQAVPEGAGGIAALLGLADDVVTEICASVTSTGAGLLVAPINFNAPGQVVIAGHAQAVDSAIDEARQAGVKRAIPLPMSVPVHCELMRPATAKLQAELDQIDFQVTAFPILHNADISARVDAAGIRSALAAQLVLPVRWSETVAALRLNGVDTVIEFGPGRVLTGLNKRIDRDMANFAIHDPASLQKALAYISHQDAKANE